MRSQRGGWAGGVGEPADLPLPLSLSLSCSQHAEKPDYHDACGCTLHQMATPAGEDEDNNNGRF